VAQGQASRSLRGGSRRRVPVVISTRVHTGRVQPLYANKGGGVTLQQIGCVLADNLSPQKARLLLMLALTRTQDTKAPRQYFDR
jgi:L-asparaginase